MTNQVSPSSPEPVTNTAQTDSSGLAPGHAPAGTMVSAPESGADQSGSQVSLAERLATQSDHTDQQSGPGLLTRSLMLMFAVLIGVAGGALALTWLFGNSLAHLNPFTPTATERSGPTVLVSLTDLSTYHAASGYYELVIDQSTGVENVPSFLAGERVVFVAAGTVDATVDFASLQAANVRSNPDRTEVEIDLPAVQLGAPQLDLDRSYVASRQRGLRERLFEAADSTSSSQDLQALYLTAEQRLASAGAESQDLKVRARQNTRAMLTSLLGGLGYTRISVSFADE